MERTIFKLKEDLSPRFKAGTFVFREDDFPVCYLVLCDEEGLPILDYKWEEEGEEILYDWHPACDETCPWLNKLEVVKTVEIEDFD